MARKKKERVPETYPIFDGHNDALISLRRLKGRFTTRRNGANHQITLPQMRQGNVVASFWAVFIEPGRKPEEAQRETIKGLKEYHRFLNRHQKSFRLALRASDVDQARRERKIAVLLHLEGFGCLDRQFRGLEEVYRLGVRSIGLTWNGENQLATGVGGDPRSALTRLGRELIVRMNRMGMLIDLSHINEAGFWEILKVSRAPVIESHGNCFSICPDPRNLKDDQLRALAAKKGVLGVFFSKKFLTGGKIATLEDVCKHLCHAVRVAGIESVGIGSDFGGIVSGVPDGLENIGKLPSLFRVMRAKGYSKTDLERISFGNFYRVVKEVLG